MTVPTAIGAFALTVSGQPLFKADLAPIEPALRLVSDYRWVTRTGAAGQNFSNGAIVVSSAPFKVSAEIDSAMRKAVHASLEHKYFL